MQHLELGYKVYAILNRREFLGTIAAAAVVPSLEAQSSTPNEWGSPVFDLHFHMRPLTSFEELSDNPAWVEEIRELYNGDLDAVDLVVGMFAEPKPKGFGFSDTAFRVFVLMATRRLEADRFFTVDYRPEVYTKAGLQWIDANTMSTVLLRHFPELEPALRGVDNPFAPWQRV